MDFDHPTPHQTPRRVKILRSDDEYRFGRLFRIVRAEISHERYDGTWSKEITRINFERADGVGILLYDPQRDVVVLVEQFRYPAYARLYGEESTDDARGAWLLEVVAGVHDEGLSAEQTARKELLEEAGYRLRGDLRRLITFFPSPGGTSEQVTLFVAEIEPDDRVEQGGGVDAEGEDVRVVEMQFETALNKIRRGEIVDAKTVIALQALALEKLGGIEGGSGLEEVGNKK